MKIEPIRAADRKICDRALMERWLYGKVTASGELYPMQCLCYSLLGLPNQQIHTVN